MQFKMTKKSLYSIAFCSFAVLVVIAWIVSGGWTMSADKFIQGKIFQIYNQTFGWAMEIVSLVISPAVLFVTSLVSSLILFNRGKRKSSLVFVIGVGCSSLLSYLLKDIFARTRPIASLTSAIGYSFPSGHATTSAAFFLLMIYFFKNRFKSKFFRALFIILNVFFFALVGFSRIYLNMHWTSDVIGGFSLGLLWASIVILVSVIHFRGA